MPSVTATEVTVPRAWLVELLRAAGWGGGVGPSAPPNAAAIAAAPAPAAIATEESGLGGLSIGAIAAPLVGLGIKAGLQALGEREQREEQRYDIYSALNAFASKLRTMGPEAFMYISDRDLLMPQADIMGVDPSFLLGITLPSWERGARVVARAIAEMRDAYNAPEMQGSRLPPRAILEIPSYYAAKGTAIEMRAPEDVRAGAWAGMASKLSGKMAMDFGGFF